MSVFYGVCFDSGAWGGDLTGLLVVEEDGKFVVAASHISSSEGWSRRDLLRHFDEESDEGDRFDWLGLMDRAAVEQRFDWPSGGMA